MTLFEIMFGIVSFAAGNLTMFFAKRYIAAAPEVTFNQSEMSTDSGKSLVFEAVFKKAVFGYTVLSLRANRPLFACQTEYDPENGQIVLNMERTPLQLKPFFVHDHNVLSHSDQNIVFCIRGIGPVRLTYWLRTSAFPYLMRGSRLIEPPH